MSYSLLVVDDNETYRMQVKGYLTDSNMDFIFSEAVDGQDGYEKAQKSLFDIFVFDLNMPRFNGVELSIKIRELEQYKETPIMIYTTDAQNKLAEKTRSLGHIIWCIKPMEGNHFTRALNRLLTKSKPNLKITKAS
jgi:two-component system chemotaxis response regulator CheY